MSGSIGFFLLSTVLEGYILRSPPAATFSACCISFSCPAVGGLNLPNTTVSVSSVLSRSLASGSADFGFAAGAGACAPAGGP